ncbi:hypothetical protein D1BOALGB6SA_7796 [Olavius sp. associated proteobacterium Delta 1]|nr:hypothetical protein D1BOALGB6SA_7796 [Olavius sp. associated proteobacterium Delta 1]
MPVSPGAASYQILESSLEEEQKFSDSDQQSKSGAANSKYTL